MLLEKGAPPVSENTPASSGVERKSSFASPSVRSRTLNAGGAIPGNVKIRSSGFRDSVGRVSICLFVTVPPTTVRVVSMTAGSVPASIMI